MAELNDDKLYIEAWAREMMIIWQEQLVRLNVVRSGKLYQSFGSAINAAEEGTDINMRFAQYGIYQALGTGRGYKHDNGGDLKFLDDEYRAKHRLDKPRKVGPAWGGGYTSGEPRKRRDWLNKKLYMSVMAMAEDIARITGEQGASIICDALQDSRSALS